MQVREAKAMVSHASAEQHVRLVFASLGPVLQPMCRVGRDTASLSVIAHIGDQGSRRQRVVLFSGSVRRNAGRSPGVFSASLVLIAGRTCSEALAVRTASMWSKNS